MGMAMQAGRFASASGAPQQAAAGCPVIPHGLFTSHQGFEVLSHILEHFGLVALCLPREMPQMHLAGSVPRPGVPAGSAQHEACEGLSPLQGTLGVPTKQALLLAAGNLSETGYDSCLCLATSPPGLCFRTGKSH